MSVHMNPCGISINMGPYVPIGRSELTFSNTFGPSDALALRLCSEIVQGRVRIDPPLMVFGGVLALGREPLRRVTGTFIADTVYLLIDT